MANWFECKIRYSKILETGLQKTVTESYLVDALSFTEAEARIIEEMTPFMSGEFTVSAVKREKISDVFYDATGDKWYKVKLNFITLDDRTEKEKKTSVYYLVQAKDIDDARRLTDAFMSPTAIDYTTEAVQETKIMDVFLYNPDGSLKQ